MNQLALSIAADPEPTCQSREQNHLRIPAVPIAQPRVRVSSFGGHARAYNPTTIKTSDGGKKPHPIVAFKATVRHMASLAYTAAPLSGPLRIDVTLVFPRPASAIWKTKPMPRYRHIQKPDRDNCDKAGVIFEAIRMDA